MVKWNRSSFAGTILKSAAHGGDHMEMDCPFLQLFERLNILESRTSITDTVTVERFLYQEALGHGFWVPEGRYLSDTEIVDELVAGYRRPRSR